MNAKPRIVCPKCHYLRKESDNAPEWQCPNCGVVYAKYKKPSVSSKRSLKKKLTNPKLSLHSITFIGGMMTFGLLAIKGYVGNINATSAIMAVIFYICVIPILSVPLGDSLYMWNKHSMRFEAYDKAAHPILTAVSFVLGLILAGMMVFLMFSDRLG